MTETIEHTTHEAATPTTTTAWMKVARAGASTMVAWAIILNILAGGIPPVIVIGLVFLGFVPFLRGERPRLGLAFALVSIVTLVANLPIVIDDMSNPESAPAFILNLLSVVGVAVSAIGGFAAFRRMDDTAISRVAWAAPSVFVTGAVLSLVLAAQTTSDPALPGDVEMVASGAQWQTADIEVARGDGLWIDNQDGVRHTFAIESEGFEFEIPALKSVRAEIDVAPGTYAFVCTVPGHESMVGSVTVTG